MDAKAFHEAERARDGAVRHHPHDHVHAFGRQADEVPEIVVRRLRLRKGAVRLLLDRVDDVGKLDGVLDEEHRDVVADDVPVAFLGVELDGKAAHVAREIERTLAAGDGREPHEGRRLFAGALEQVGAGVLRQRLVGLEEAVRAVAAGMHHALGNALVVEVEDLLAEMEILDQRRAARADLQRVLVVRDRAALRGGQDWRIACCDLMQFAALAAVELLIVDSRRSLPPPIWLLRGLDDLAMKFLVTMLAWERQKSPARCGGFSRLDRRVTEAAGSGGSAGSGFRAAKAEWAWSFSFPG